jgi:hypothetical protein
MARFAKYANSLSIAVENVILHWKYQSLKSTLSGLTMKNRHSLLQIEYFPTVWFFVQCCGHETVYLEACENYQKRSYRNRAQISGPNGPMWLAVPLMKGKNKQTPIREVKIAYYDSWQSTQWHSIQSAYGKTPFFEHYADFVRNLVLQKEHFLFTKNVNIVSAIANELELDVTLRFSESYNVNQSEGISDFRSKNPIPSKNEAVLHRYEQYPQPFDYKQPFRPNLSILDLVFCKGPETKHYLEKAF